MRNLTKTQKRRYGILAAVIISYIFIVFIMHWPFYYALLLYLAAFLASVVIWFPNYLAIWANYNYATGKTEKARPLLKKAIDINTKSPAAFLNYSIILVREGDGKSALSYLERALALKPKVITEKNIKLTMGSCYWVMGEIDNAISVLEGMRSQYDYVNSHVLTTLGYMYFVSGDHEKALDFTNKAIEDSPESGAAWDNLGQIYFKLGEFDKAKEAFLKATGYKSDLVDSYYYLGMIAEHENDREKAREYFEKARDLKITALNTVTSEQVNQKYDEYIKG